MDLSDNEYVIQRPMQFAWNVVYQIMDSKGNPIFAGRQHALGGSLDIFDVSGAIAASMHAKHLTLKPQYELFDANKNKLGRAIKISHLVNLNSKFDLENAGGEVIAQAIGQIFGYNYAIKDAKGEKDIAGISKASPFNAATAMDQQQGFGGLLGSMIAGAMNAYKLSIYDTSIDKLLLIVFTIAIDHIANNNNVSVGIGGMGSSTGGFGGVGGFGGPGVRL